MNISRSKGIILVTTLLFLFVLTLLGLIMVEGNINQIKMRNYLQQKIFSFYRAENYLRQGEMAAAEEDKTPSLFWSYQSWSGPSCLDKKCYKITAIDKEQSITTILHSILKVGTDSAYRIAWWRQ